MIHDIHAWMSRDAGILCVAIIFLLIIGSAIFCPSISYPEHNSRRRRWIWKKTKQRKP
jgi:hypothetical protein